MRILAALGCFAAIANGDSAFDEEELTFEQMLKKDWDSVRQLSGHNASTAPPSTQPPSTQPPSTQPPSTQPPSTQPPSTQPPVTTPPPVTAPPQETATKNTNSTCTTDCAEAATAVVTVTREFSVTSALADTLATNAAARSRRSRRLRRLGADDIKAYNFYCGAYGAAAAASVCKGLNTAGQIDPAKFTTFEAMFKDYKMCAPSLLNRVGLTDCHLGTTGFCISNPVDKTKITEHKACTYDQNMGGQSYKYHTSTSLTIPKSFASPSTTSTFATAMASAKTAADATSNTDVTASLKTYIIGAAALIKQQTALNASGLFGIDDSILDQVASGMASGSLDLASLAAGSGTKPTYFTQAETAVTSAMGTVASVVGTTTTGSSGAVSTTMAATVIVGAATALLF